MGICIWRLIKEHYGIFMKGERIVCLYIALLYMIMVQLGLETRSVGLYL